MWYRLPVCPFPVPCASPRAPSVGLQRCLGSDAGKEHPAAWQAAQMGTGCRMVTVLSDININIYINIIAAVIFYSTCFIQLGLFDA